MPSKFVGACSLPYTRLLLPFLLGAVGVGLVNSGGRADQLPQFYQSRRCPYNADAIKFHTGQGPVSPRQEGPAILSLPAGRNCQANWMASPVNGGLGGDAYEHWCKPSAHRKRPPVTLWFLSGDPERNPPRRAEPFSKKVGRRKDGLLLTSYSFCRSHSIP